MFLNLLKTAQSWSYLDNSGVPAPDELDSNGYPLSGANCFSHSGVYTRFFGPSQADRPGDYVITWNGNGTIYVAGGTPVSGSKTSSSGPGRYVYTPTAPGITFEIGIASAGSPHITNLKVFHVNDEALIDAGEVFGTKLKQRSAELRAGVKRFLDTQNANVSNVTTWATRKSAGYVFYEGQEYRANLYGGVTGGTGDAYTVDAPSAWAGLVDKATVIVKFDRTSTSGDCTLAVGGTAAKPIRQTWGANVDIFGVNRPYINTIGTLIYDEVLDCWIKYGGDNGLAGGLGNQGLGNYCPPELMLQLASEIGEHPWFVTPYLTIDPPTDYMRSLATYARDNQPSWMKPRYEGTNETWNGLFAVTRYAYLKANVYWGTSSENNWYGMQMSVLGQIISDVYSADRSKYEVVAGMWTSVTPLGNGNQNTRLNAPSYVASGPSRAPYTQTPAYQWVTQVAMANYFSYPSYFTPQELKDGYAYLVTHAADAAAQLALANSYADDLLGAAAPYNLAYLRDRADEWYSFAQGPWGGSYALGLMFYEGGYSPDYLPYIAWSSTIAAATAANPVVLTLATTSNAAKVGQTGNAAVVGMALTISELIGGMTELNGNTYTVSAVNVGGDPLKVAINVDGTGFTPFKSEVQTGTITFLSNVITALTDTSTLLVGMRAIGTDVLGKIVSIDSPTQVTLDSFLFGATGSRSISFESGKSVYVDAWKYVVPLRHASKFAPNLTAHVETNFADMIAAGGTYPSHFMLAGNSSLNNVADTLGLGQVWGLFDPNVYGVETASVSAITRFNNKLRRTTLVASA